ncbi:sn-glycerol-3-phosphate transporter [Pseudomonas sp.]|uniref:sn-glycerol-3-phosphate transporter n=1 Tax=Pseudomonas sp. TaxID=306 RepID=UPI002729C3A2|nr:sn-glycerol-3-phosphate transporter [Pseudomonas sp.]
MTHRKSWVLALTWLAGAGLAQAQNATDGSDEPLAGKHWQLQTSLYTRHFSPDPRHNNRQELLALERHRTDGVLGGGATFRNSFGQRSIYLYIGRQFPVQDLPVHFKLTGGMLHGYRGEYWDKIPLNRFRVAPAIVPSVGFSQGPFVGELVLVGAAATMVTAGVRF